MAESEEKLHIVLFPWLAFGHIIPFLELAKLIAQKGHHISFISTPRNIERLPKLPPNLAFLIKYVKLPLPKVDNLPENAETTTDVPSHIVQHLKKAFDGLQEPVTKFLESSNADWILHDFAPFWIASVASKLGIRTAFFTIFAASFAGYMGPAEALLGDSVRDITVPPPWVPFPTTVAVRHYELKRSADILSGNDSGVSDMYRTAMCLLNCDLLAIRGCTEFEPEWFQVVEKFMKKPVLPVGQLPSTGFDDGNDNEAWQWMKAWLDKQAHCTVVYVAFGSETKPNQEEVSEIALGLEKSNLPFLWVLIARRGPSDQVVLQLPEGFEERTKGRGVVCTTWAPQLKILGHEAVGGFLTHAGGTSIAEAVQNEKPMIVLAFTADQGINARVLEEKKMGYSVPRDERDGSFTSDLVADSVRLVLLEEEGRIYREKIKEVKNLFITERQERYIDNLLTFLKTHRNPMHACGNN